MILTLNRKSLLFIIGLWWILFSLLSTVIILNNQITNITNFLSLLLIPGLLTVLALRLEGLDKWAYVSLAVAFSLLEIMLIGFLSNSLLPLFGITRPLDKPYILWELSQLVIALIGIGLIGKNDHIKIKLDRHFFFEKLRGIFFVCIPILFVFQAVIGALMLNNGYGNILTLSMLGEMSVYTVILYCLAEKLNERVIPIALSMMSLALLLMTSMRGWYITGHDIQLEYKVFELAKNAGFWTMATYRDAYNACLSITILPTIFSNFLTVADQYIYKLFFQIIFSLCAGIMFLISRQWLNRRMSLLAGFYFVAFPTFFQDMPFLIRQEIAFLFYGLMLYIIFKESVNIQMRRILFMLMGIGVILSHYATTYTVLTVFGLSAISLPLFTWTLKKFQKKLALNNYSPKAIMPRPTKITIWMVVILMSLNFLWTTVITDTGGNVINVLKETLTATRNGFTENVRSFDAIGLLTFKKPDQTQAMSNYIKNVRSFDAIGLLTFKKPDQTQAMSNYIKNVVNPLLETSSPGEYFDEQTYAKFIIKPLIDEVLPLTHLGSLISRLGINVAIVTRFMGKLLSKLMGILVPIVIVYVFLRKSVGKQIDKEFYLLSLYSMLFIIVNIVLPVLSIEYGIFRVIQQSMFIIAPFMLLGSVIVGGVLARPIFRKVSHYAPVVLAISCFLYSTALIPQLLGGNNPLLHLNNMGSSYDNFLTHKSELYGINWLEKTLNDYSTKYHESQPELQADKFTQSKIKSLTNLEFSQDIFPRLIKRDSYVFLSWSNVTKQRAVVVYNGDMISYNFQMEIFDDNKNLIYNNGGVRVYR